MISGDILKVSWDRNHQLPMLAKAADPITLHKATGTTCKRVGNSIMSAGLRASFGRGKQYKITVKNAKEHGHFKSKSRNRWSGNVFEAAIFMDAQRIKLTHFSPRIKSVMSRIGRRKAVTVEVARGNRRVARISSRNPAWRAGRYGGMGEFSGFWAAGKGGKWHVWARENEPQGSRADRYPIYPMTTGAPTVLMFQEAGREAMNQKADERFEKEFIRNLEFYMNRAAQKGRGRRR